MKLEPFLRTGVVYANHVHQEVILLKMVLQDAIFALLDLVLTLLTLTQQ